MHRFPLLPSVLLAFGLINATPAVAAPEIASGDRLLNTDASGCLARVDDLITELNIEFARGSMDRTGYFEDGAFRILCYGTGDQSMAVVFASHNDSLDVATSFVRMALDQLSSNTVIVPTGADEQIDQPNSSVQLQ